MNYLSIFDEFFNLWYWCLGGKKKIRIFVFVGRDTQLERVTGLAQCVAKKKMEENQCWYCLYLRKLLWYRYGEGWFLIDAQSNRAQSTSYPNLLSLSFFEKFPFPRFINLEILFLNPKLCLVMEIDDSQVPTTKQSLDFNKAHLD